MPFIDKELVKEKVSFNDAIELLGLRMPLAGNQFRSACPCGAGDKRALVITPGTGFYCQGAKTGGDVIKLVMHVRDCSFTEALRELAEFAGMDTSTASTSTVPGNRSRERQEPESERGQINPPRPRGGGQPPPQPTREPFDPEAFWAKTAYTAEVAALGITEDQADALGIGFYRGKLYQALRYANGQVAGFSAFANGELKLPANLLPMSNVVPLQKRA